MKIRPNEEFALWRKRENLSQKEIAHSFSISQGYVSHMEQGLRNVSKEIKAEMPKTMKVSEGDEFFLRMRRLGINMNMGVKMFKVNHNKLLKYIRDEQPIPKSIWEILEADEAKFAAFKETQT